MLVRKYLERLQQSYTAFFDVYKNKTIASEVFDIYAYSRIKHQKYIGIKKFKVLEYENYEYCLVKLYADIISKKNIDVLIECLKKSIDILVSPHFEHMSSVITCVIISDKSITECAINRVEKTKIARMFAFGFKGWCDVRIVLVDLKNNKIFCNKKGREIADFYKPENILNTWDL